MTLRLGLLGAAAIAPRAIIKPVQVFDDVEIVSMAARDRSRAEVFAARAGIATVHDTYDQVVTDPSVDAVYNPLAISGHHEWTIKALNAGKHVLCEKPFAMNEAEAREMADCARENGLVCAEAFHYYYHPVFRRMRRDRAERSPGRDPLRRRALPEHRRGNPRADSLPDRARRRVRPWTSAATRCTTSVTAFGAEPEVVAAKAGTVYEHIDVEMEAELLFPGGIPARIWSRMNAAAGWSSVVNVYGDRGRSEGGQSARPPPRASSDRTGHLTWGTRRETLTKRSTFDYQLQAFVDAIDGVRPMPTDAEDGVISMRVIDNVYRAAGMTPRGTGLDLRATTTDRIRAIDSGDQLGLSKIPQLRQRPELSVQGHRGPRRNLDTGATPRGARSVRHWRWRHLDHGA